MTDETKAFNTLPLVTRVMIENMVRSGSPVIPVYGPADPFYSTRPDGNEDDPGKVPKVKWRGIVNAFEQDQDTYILNEFYKKQPWSVIDNYAVLLRKVDLVIDVDHDDMDPSKLGLASLEKLNKATKLDLVAECTFAVKTGRGGMHLYFTNPKSEIFIKKNLDEYPNIDFLTYGAYVIGPNSLHRRGVTYTVISKHRDLIYKSIAPLRLVQHLNDLSGQRRAMHEVMGISQSTSGMSAPANGEPAQHWEVRDGTLCVPGLVWDDDTALSKAHAFWRKQTAVVRNRNNALLKIISVLKDFGISKDTNEKLYLQYQTQVFPDPMPFSEVQSVINNAYTYAKSPAGSFRSDLEMMLPVAEGVEPEKGLSPHEADAQMEQIRESTWWRQLQYKIHEKSGTKNLVKNSSVNARLLLQNLPAFRNNVRLNRFTGKMVLMKEMPWTHLTRGDAFKREMEILDGAQWTDSDSRALRAYLQEYVDPDLNIYGFDCSIKEIYEQVATVAESCSFDSVQETLTNFHIGWDRKKRLDTWLADYCGVENTPYVSAIGRNWALGVIFRNMNPGHKFDQVLILEGYGGIGKSEFFRIMAIRPGWFGDMPIDLHDGRKIGESVAGRTVVEMPEGYLFGRDKIEIIKRFFTTQVDTFRGAYERYTVDVPRRAVFGISINRYDYLVPDGGNRRFWPLRIPDGHLPDVRKLAKDMPQIYGEAMEVFRLAKEASDNGGQPLNLYSLFLTPELEKIAEAERDKRMYNDDRASSLAEFLDKKWQETGMKAPPEEVKHGHLMAISVKDIAENFMHLHVRTFGRREQTLVGEWMRDLGWSKFRSNSRGTMYKREKPLPKFKDREKDARNEYYEDLMS